jgi:hydroxypyruvate isomerase
MSGPVLSRLACADSTFPKLSHATALAVIADLGIPAVDICVFPEYAHTTPATVRSDPAAAAAAVGDRLEEAGLAVADVFLILGFEEQAVNHPDAEVRRESLAYFEAALELARRLSAPGLSLLPGMPFESVEPEVNLTRAAEELERRAELAGEAGLALSIEPHYQSLVETPELVGALLERAPNVSLALDYSHFVFQGFAQEEIDEFIPRARHVHLRQAAEGSMQLPARDGAIDFPALWRALEVAGYDGYLTLEYQWEEWLDCRRVDCISETAELRDILVAGTAADGGGD